MKLSDFFPTIIIANELWGFVVYKIADDNCLNGLWTNNHRSQNIMNEIARQTSKDKDDDNIVGSYTCAYIEDDGTPFTGKLKIQRGQINRIYELEWTHIRDTGNISTEFKGIGMLTELNQLVAIYWQTN